MYSIALPVIVAADSVCSCLTYLCYAARSRTASVSVDAGALEMLRPRDLQLRTAAGGALCARQQAGSTFSR